MRKKHLRLFVFVLCLGSLKQLSGSAADLPPALESIPQNSALVVEISRPRALLEPLLKPEMAQVAAVFESSGKAQLAELKGVVAYLESRLGTDWRSALLQLAGQGVTLGADTSGGLLISVDGSNEKLLNQLHDIIREFAQGEAEKQGRSERIVSRQYQDQATWTFGPKEAHALLGSRLVLANSGEALERSLDLRKAKGNSIVSSASFKSARQAVGKDAVLTAFLNLESLRHTPGLQKALADDSNPLGMLLLADTKEALRNATWLALGAYVRDGKLLLKTFTDGRAPESSKAAAFARPQGSDEGFLPNLSVPGHIASMSFCRDLRAFYTAKDDLFPDRTSGLVFFENMMGIFFSGIDLTEGVLAQLRPDIRVVVAAQKFDPAIGTPALQMPGFAAVLRLRDAAKFGETVEEAWQKALGLVNFTRGQKALPGLTIDRAAYGDVKYTVSYYRAPEEKGQKAIDARYNYRPTLARPGDYVILSSTDGLAKDLIEVLKKESGQSVKGSPVAHSVAEIDGGSLRAILAANRENIVQKNMVDKGNTREQAEKDIGFLLTALEGLDRAVMSISRENGSPSVSVDLKLKYPAGKSDKAL